MRSAAPTEKQIDYSLLDKCLAHAVAQGDIVNLRFLFMPSSPFRAESTELLEMSKYAYLLPENEEDRPYRDALSEVQQHETARFIKEQLQRQGPPQLPWALVMQLGDNAVRLGKYTAASQAYEMLRIRRRMQLTFLDQADARLEQNRTPEAVQGYRIASGLNYDYGAFPEPLPAVPNFQERALFLHGNYPASPEQALARQADTALLKTGLAYFFANSEITNRLDALPESGLLDFFVALVQQTDQDWGLFVKRYHDALEIVEKHHVWLDKINTYSPDALGLLFEQLLDSEQIAELRQAPSLLLGSDNPQPMDWWQCLKTLAYRHPGAALFIRRQRLAAKEEILIPCFNPDSCLVRALGLTV